MNRDRRGRPTASNDSLDGDMIIAAQGIKVKDFEEILNNLA